MALITKLCYAECQYAECQFAECQYAECQNAECQYAECQYAECHNKTIRFSRSNPQTLDQARKACQGQTLAYYEHINYVRKKI
jgi:hypothetical protein